MISDLKKIDVEEYIWNYITKHAADRIGGIDFGSEIELDENLKSNILYLIMVNIQNGDDDDIVVSKVQAQFMILGFIADESYLKSMISNIRTKCEMELFVLGIASDLLFNLKEQPIIVYSKVKKLLP